jgi:hypothetical protein
MRFTLLSSEMAALHPLAVQSDALALRARIGWSRGCCLGRPQVMAPVTPRAVRGADVVTAAKVVRVMPVATRQVMTAVVGSEPTETIMVVMPMMSMVRVRGRARCGGLITLLGGLGCRLPRRRNDGKRRRHEKARQDTVDHEPLLRRTPQLRPARIR